MTERAYTIIGNSAAAVAAVEAIRSVDSDGAVTLLAREPYHTYSRPLVPYLLAGKVTEERMAYRPADFCRRNRVTALLGVEATRVRTADRVVETADGRALTFATLLIATGATPVIPEDVEGIDADGVFTLAAWADADAVREFISCQSVKEAVVIGGGPIGLRAVGALADMGLRTAVVELADRVLPSALDPVAGGLARARLERTGVSVVCGTTAARIAVRDGRVSGVVLRSGEQLPCQVVIVAIGVRPNCGLVAGTQVEVDSGILVDDRMQTSVGGIFAAGDVAQGVDLLSGGRRPIPILPNAFRQGFVAGCNMAGWTRRWPGGFAMNSVDIFGLPFISMGTTACPGSDCRSLAVLDEEEPWYRKIVIREGRVVGALFVGKIDRAGIFAGLIRHGVDVSAFADVLLTDCFGLISLPKEYRKHVVSGAGIEV
jgi:NAD(P)H-nitrite reductase large subunit